MLIVSIKNTKNRDTLKEKRVIGGLTFPYKYRNSREKHGDVCIGLEI